VRWEREPRAGSVRATEAARSLPLPRLHVGDHGRVLLRQHGLALLVDRLEVDELVAGTAHVAQTATLGGRAHPPGGEPPCTSLQPSAATAEEGLVVMPAEGDHGTIGTSGTAEPVTAGLARSAWPRSCVRSTALRTPQE